MRFKLILLICVPLSMSMRTLRANGLPRANACPFIYGTEAYNLNTAGAANPRSTCRPRTATAGATVRIRCAKKTG
ncbi:MULTISPECIES: hypothetical protein [unclassified Burkholderia]|uniref:hypothetical protein n=1 Tax=unclassified Burkholderia TaxID=2613784 RepID=UPI0014246BB9|nr:MULTISPECIES: hypothetical protein [unclassified Burkholderia]